MILKLMQQAGDFVMALGFDTDKNMRLLGIGHAIVKFGDGTIA